MTEPSHRASRLGFIFLLFILCAGYATAQEFGLEAVRTHVNIIAADGKSSRVILNASHRYNAPSWSPDGTNITLSSGGELWRIPTDASRKPKHIPIGSEESIDINHGISPDGQTIAFGSRTILLTSATGGSARQLTARTPSFFHGWSPDGKTITCAARRGRGCEIFSIEVATGDEHPLTTNGAYSDSSSFSPDGRWVYFNADYSGVSAIWRVPANGGPAAAERVFDDGRENWEPRPSPDGKWLIFLSYPKKTTGHAFDRDVTIRRIPLPAEKVQPAIAENLVHFIGGHGSLGARPWSPDGKHFVYLSYEPPPPALHIVFLTPSDIGAPAGYQQKITKIANYTEKYFFDAMKKWNYPPAVESLFAREPDDSVKILSVQSPKRAAVLQAMTNYYAPEVVRQATRQYHIAGDRDIWWIFVYLGDRPARFNNYRGAGDSRDGGTAMVNYDTLAGEVRSDLSPAEGFNGEIFLKGMIHELGHALGLPHSGPDLPLGLGNSLMGATTVEYKRRNLSQADQIYLPESDAAMLWKHPLFTGIDKKRTVQPVIQSAGCHAAYAATNDRVIITGKLIADMSAHSVIIIEDQGKNETEYWYRCHSARLASDGAFQVTFDHPPKNDGQYLVAFCFENGMITGDGAGVTSANRGYISLPYQNKSGAMEFPVNKPAN